MRRSKMDGRTDGECLSIYCLIDCSMNAGMNAGRWFCCGGLSEALAGQAGRQGGMYSGFLTDLTLSE